MDHPYEPKSRITYFSGAGASAQSMPVVKNFTDRMEYFFHFMGGDIWQSTEKWENEVWQEKWGITQQDSDFFFEKFTEIIYDSKSHYSIDTYARKLFLTSNTDDTKYKELKAALSCFLLFEQMEKEDLDDFTYRSDVLRNVDQEVFKQILEPLDKRWDALLSLLVYKKNPQKVFNELELSAYLPEQVNFITWNYDLQFEIAFSGFLGLAYIEFLDQFDLLKKQV